MPRHFLPFPRKRCLLTKACLFAEYISVERRQFLRSSLYAALGLSLAPLGSLLGRDLKTGLWEADDTPQSILKRKIPVSGEEISALGLGTRTAFDALWQRYEELSFVLDVFHREGGMVLDTSPTFGEAETALGHLTAHTDYFTVTKLAEGDIPSESFKRSLSRLRRKRLSCLLIEGTRNVLPYLKTIRELKEEQKIKYWGILETNVRYFSHLRQAMIEYRPDIVEISYNVAEREAEKEIFPTAQEYGIGLLVCRPFAGGHLLFPSRSKNEFLKDFDCQSRAQALIKFVLSFDVVSCVLVGTGNPSHMKENLQAARGFLPSRKERENLAHWLLL
ncbi:MAG: aldo/keto reductase [Leptospiraceae bacterium]|nr:aldo/keto reductase [Leptospiraceae bacterium]MDW8307325.1 aldo/keto reductase [Leptospiraceae bacterium]